MRPAAAGTRLLRHSALPLLPTAAAAMQRQGLRTLLLTAGRRYSWSSEWATCIRRLGDGGRSMCAATAARGDTSDTSPAEALDQRSGGASGGGAPLDPGLYVVGTPIGNLEDISARALRVLRSASMVLAEDTRHSRKLLDHFGICTPLLSCHEHNERQRVASVVARLQGGEAMALISDAGMPAISDPGADLVAAAAAAGVPIIPIPGPCAALCALVGSGLPPAPFLFVGFLPPKQAARRAALRRLAGQRASLVFYVPPHGLLAVLEDAAAELGPERRCCVARELTKLHEEFTRSTLAGVLEDYASRDAVRGEIVLVVEGAPSADADAAEAGAAAALAAAARQREEPAASIGGSSSGSSSLIRDGKMNTSDGDGSDGSSSDGNGAVAAAAAAAGAAAAAAASAAAGDPAALRALIAEGLRSGASVSGLSRDLAKRLGMGRSAVYKLALQVEAEEAARPGSGSPDKTP